MTNDESFPLGPFILPTKHHQHTQKLIRWLRCEHLPKNGWFIPNRNIPNTPTFWKLPPSKNNDRPKHHIDQSPDFSQSYPWRSHVVAGDVYVYRASRVLALCIRHLKLHANHTHNQAICLLRKLLVLDPLAGLDTPTR